jgi:condensation domain-containing protein
MAGPDEEFRLSDPQAAMWHWSSFFAACNPHDAKFHVVRLMTISNRGGVEKLAHALTSSIASCDSLGIRFRKRPGQVVQVFGLPRSHDETLDLRFLETAGADVDGAILRLVTERFDLENGPLARALLGYLGEDKLLLAFVAHHLVVDGLSVELVVTRAHALYRSTERALRPPPVSYRTLLQKPMDMRRTERNGKYWAALMRDSGRDLLLCPEREAVTRYSEGRERFELSETLASKIHSLSMALRASLFHVCLGVWLRFLLAQTPGTTITVGTPTTGRYSPDSQGAVGQFAEIIFLRVDLTGSTTLEDVVRRCRQATAEAFDHLPLPFAAVVGTLEEWGYTPPFPANRFYDTWFSLGRLSELRSSAESHTGDYGWFLPESIYDLQCPDEAGIWQHDNVTLDLVAGPRSLAGMIEGNRELFPNLAGITAEFVSFASAEVHRFGD